MWCDYGHYSRIWLVQCACIAHTTIEKNAKQALKGVHDGLYNSYDKSTYARYFS